MTRLKIVSLVIVGASAVGGCSTNKETVWFYPRYAGGYTKSSTDHSVGNGGDRIGTVGSVRSSELVKVYGVNRYVDPSDPRIMHERHVVYRLEEQPGWTVRTPRGGTKVLMGPILGLNRAEYQPAPDAAEMGRELMTARRAAEENNKYLEEVREKLAVLEAATKESLANQQKLNQVTQALADRIQRSPDPAGTGQGSQIQNQGPAPQP